MSDAQSAVEYAHKHYDRFIEELKAIVAIPSISTGTDHVADVKRAAEWMADHLRAVKMENVQVMPTRGHPVVYGDWLKAGKNKPIILIYGHYDVQPVDPIDLWESSPFEAMLRGDHLFGRGTSDMKGQVVASIKAIESIVQTSGLPVNVKWLIEGEEEVGSENLDEFIKAHKELLACDFCLNPDAGMIAADQPTITYGLRGLMYSEVRVYGPDRDLHSGLFGGTVHNPAQALIELIAGMHDAQGRVTLPGFYDKVRPLSKEEHADFARLPMTEQFYLDQTKVPALWGEPDYLPVERVGARPTLEVNGFLSGFTGQGSKTVLPAWAMAKISCRLVPDQVPEEVYEQLKKYMEVHAPKTIRWEVTSLHNSGVAITDRNNAAVKAMSSALETVWGKRPLFKREGGSIGVVVQLQNNIGAESVLTGFGLPEDNVHSPNEKLHLPTWKKGLDALIHFFYNVALNA
ncbi:MAG TPA: dipeptidase [Anaerolineales bacterium]|jgi:acetylornithine deacetylase/succinyl-diaminopimelate desuccinylase-like protein